MTRLLTSVGALAVAAIALAFPAPAKPKGGDVGQCLNLCNQLPINNRGHCQSYCIRAFPRKRRGERAPQTQTTANHGDRRTFPSDAARSMTRIDREEKLMIRPTFKTLTWLTLADGAVLLAKKSPAARSKP